MPTTFQLFRQSSIFLKNKKIKNPFFVAEELLSFVMQLSKEDLFLEERNVSVAQQKRMRSFLNRKARGEPLEYIIGKVSFYECSIMVTPSVLIPRPETELLVDLVCKKYLEKVIFPKPVLTKPVLIKPVLIKKILWDVCCGSGCIAISIKKYFNNNIIVHGSDISEDALSLAKKNSQYNNTDITFHNGDLLVPFKGKADFVVCNPPYVSYKEYEHMGRESIEFEPKISLVAEEEGYIFYRRLSQELPDYLKEKAKVFFEIGAFQKEKILNYFINPCWKNKIVEKDLSGHDRFIIVEFA